MDSWIYNSHFYNITVTADCVSCAHLYINHMVQGGLVMCGKHLEGAAAVRTREGPVWCCTCDLTLDPLVNEDIPRHHEVPLLRHERGQDVRHVHIRGRGADCGSSSGTCTL